MKLYFKDKPFLKPRFVLSILIIFCLGGSVPYRLAFEDTGKQNNRVNFRKQTSLQAPLGACPQTRYTHMVPPFLYNKKNPLTSTPENLFIGQLLYNVIRNPLACRDCHGEKGDGEGLKWAGLDTPPRNFTCKKTMKEIPDGQLFGVIKYGSPGTKMFAYDLLEDDQIWQLVLYIRQFAK